MVITVVAEEAGDLSSLTTSLKTLLLASIELYLDFSKLYDKKLLELYL